MAGLVDVYAARDDGNEDDNDSFDGSDDLRVRQPSRKRRRDETGSRKHRHGGDGGRADEDGDDEEDEQGEDDSSEEDDDDNEEEMRKVAEGFIVEDEDEDEGAVEGEGDDEDGGEGADDRPRKKKRRVHRSRRRSASAELDEDDLDLLDENLGRQSGRRSPMPSKFKRIRRGARTPSPSRRRGVDEIFSDEEDHDDEIETGPPRGEFEGFIEDDDEADSEDDDLIAEARRLHQRQQQRTTYLPNEAGIDQDALEEITQLFGDGLDYDFAMESSEEEEQEEQEQGEERLPKEVQLKDVFEPSELTERLLTDADELIRITDEPERFQLYRLQQTPPLEIDIEKESTWITQRLLARPYKHPVEAKLQVAFRQSIVSVLNFFNTESLEVPFIWQQRRDFLYYPDREVDEETGDVVLKALRVLIDQDDLWKVWEEDGKYRAIQQRLTHLKAIWEGLDKSDRVVEETLPNIDSIEDVQDLHDYIYFTYSEQIRDRQLLENGANETAPGYKRAAGNKMAIWERYRSSLWYELVKAFGISASDFGINVRDGTRRFWTEDPRVGPEDMATEYLESYKEANTALTAAKQMLIEEIFHDPNVRKFVRKMILGGASGSSRARYSVKPTERGLKKLDDSHPYYHIKYLANQRVTQVPMMPDRFLQIMTAESEGLVVVDFTIPNVEDQIKELTHLITSDNFSDVALAWNKLREEVLHDALGRLIPFTIKLAKEYLRVECEDILATSCRQRFTERLDQAPWKGDDMEKGQIPNVLAVSCGNGDRARDAVVCAFVNDTGRLVEQIQLSDVSELENHLALEAFIRKHNPDVVGLGGFSVQTTKLNDDIVKMMDNRQDAKRQVIYVNDEVARLYQNSKRGVEEFPDVGSLTRYCIAMARYIQDPLMEYIAMGRDILSIPVHKHQSLVGEEKLYRAIETAIVDIANLCGVDINDAVINPYRALALPFISGLGPRKSQSLLKKINSVGGFLDNRSELVTKQIVSKNIFMNCASFLIINGSGKEADPLDTTRIHPEDYDLAKKMAADALELDEEDVVMAESDGDGVIKQLLQDDPDKLNDLVLEDYAEQLAKEFNQLKRNTLEQIKDELQNPYEELRRNFRALSVDQVFTMLTGETEESLREGMIVPVSIRRVGDRLSSGYLDCGVEGQILQGEMHDDPNVVGSQLFHVNQTVNAVILTLERSTFQATLSARQSKIEEARRLAKSHPEINPEEWDDFAEERDRNKAEAKREAENKASRVIKHPLFHPFNSRQAEEYLSRMQRGDAVIRPSSLGTDHIAITWKVAENVYQHIDVLELDKANEFSVGRQLRVGRKYTYSDLDELIVSHIKAMARKVDEMTTHEKFQKGTRKETGVPWMEQWLTSYSEANPRRSAYAFCLDREHPGYFDLCFKTNPKTPVKSWPVKVVPGAFMLKDNIYGDMSALSNGFKLLFTTMQREGRSR